MSSSQPKRRANADGSSSASARRHQQPNQRQDAASATHQAQSITSALLRTKNMMSQEIDRVTTLNTTIHDDGALLAGAKEEHAGMGGTMKGARSMMRKLGRQDVRDAIILRCAIIFYWVVVAYVLWSRIKVPFLP
mmetsp:Transcript_24032/g.51873  ORF Transcript_24032/g.51873 Transcript_24032/m.51873 type:complete len:135 (-) Transcript_24032:597-1001(-)